MVNHKISIKNESNKLMNVIIKQDLTKKKSSLKSKQRSLTTKQRLLKKMNRLSRKNRSKTSITSFKPRG